MFPLTHVGRLSLSLLLACLVLAACTTQRSDDMQGKWAVDMDKTLANATAAGMPAQGAPQVRQTYEGGMMEITGNTMVFTITGYEGNTTWTYQRLGGSGGCHDLLIESRNKATYCVSGDTLEVKDPSTRLVVAYKRI